MVYALAAVTLVAVAIAVRLALRERSARRSGERAEALAAQVMLADERARREIAQSLHDKALQSLLAANQELQEASPGRAGVGRAHEVVSATIQELREAVSAIHPVTLEEGGLETALAAVARHARRQGRFETSVTVEPGVPTSRDELVLAVARELVNNAAEHAGASRVDLAVRADGPCVELVVRDDGTGMEAERPEEALAEGHIGLASIAHRVEVIGGTFTLEPRMGGGTLARALLPVD